MEKEFISTKDTVLVVIDIQEKLLPAIKNKDEIEKNAKILLEMSKILDIPVIITEQYPKGLGKTIKEIKKFVNNKPVEKITFDSFLNNEFEKTLKNTGRKNILLCGIETHICILQTALSGLKKGYNIHLICDATGSRDINNYKIAINRLLNAGAILTSTEIALFQLVKSSKTSAFKKLLQLIK